MHNREPEPPTTLEIVILAVLTVYLALALPTVIIIQLVRALT